MNRACDSRRHGNSYRAAKRPDAPRTVADRPKRMPLRPVRVMLANRSMATVAQPRPAMRS